MNRRWRLLPGLAVWAAAAVLLLSGRPDLTASPASGSEGASAAQVARSDAEVLLDVSGRNTKRSLEKLSSHATGAWGERLAAGAGELMATLRRTSARSDGHVDRVAVAENGADAATVLVAASRLTSARQAGPMRTYLLVFSLKRADNDWRVSSVEVAS